MEKASMFNKEYDHYTYYDVSGFNGSLVASIICSSQATINKLANTIKECGFTMDVNGNEINVTSLTMFESDAPGYYCLFDSNYKNHIRLYKSGWHLEIVTSDKIRMGLFSEKEFSNPPYIKPGSLFKHQDSVAF